MTDIQQRQYEEQHRRWYAEWIQKQYDGPGCRAKIVGRIKYEQIMRAVKGELRRAADNSKFRFWVRAKGFRMGRPTSGTAQVDDGDSLYVVDTRNGGSLQASGTLQQHCYKKVAVVDEFFDIIYRVHCSGSGISARHSGQKRTHRMIMETYAFLPREAVTAFLMGCPQCSTNGAASTAVVSTAAVESPPQRPPSQQQQQQQPQPVAGGFDRVVDVGRWSPSFACSTPVKRECGADRTAAGVDKENATVDDGGWQTPEAKGGNKRKRTVPLRRFVRQPCRAIEIAAAASAATAVTVADTSGSGSSSTLKNSSHSSCTLMLSSSSSSSSLSLSSATRTDRSGVSRSSGGWWPGRVACRNGSRCPSSVGGASDFWGVAGHAQQPLDLSASPSSAVRSSTSPPTATEDFVYERRRVRRRRVRPKRLNGSAAAGRRRRGGRRGDAADSSGSELDGDGDGDDDDEDEEGTADGADRGAGGSGVLRVGAVADTCGENDGPRPAKLIKMGDRGDNNNVDDYYDKATAAAAAATAVVAVAVSVTTTAAAAATGHCAGHSDRTMSKDALVMDVMTEVSMATTVDAQKGSTANDETEIDEPDDNQEKSAAMHSPMNKRINGSGHHPYHMHHNPRSIMNGLTTSSSQSSLSKSLDTITTSSTTHHNFHRHWLDMANDSVNNTNLMDVDGSADDNSMAAAAAAAAAALLFSPPSSVGSGISPGGPLSSLHPNSHLAHHHALSPLAPLTLPPHSGSTVGLTPAHHHHHQHIQQQLQQYAAAAVAAATAAAAAAAAASSAGDSTSPPPTLPLSLQPMAHHYNQNNNISGSNKRRSSGGTGLTVQQQLYRRSGTPTSSTTSSPSPRPLNSKNDADTTTSGSGLHENGSFSTSGPPTTTTTVLWPPLGLLTAAHQQHHHSLSSPPKFQQLFGSSVNSLATVSAGSQVLPSLPPPPISSPSSYRLASKETNGMSVTTTNGNITGNDIGIGTGTENVINADEEDTAIDDDEDEEDEEDEEEEEEDLDDDDIEEGEEDADEDEDGDRAIDGGDGNGAQARRLRRQQARRLRQLQRTGNGNSANNVTDGSDSGITTSYHQHWQQPSTTTTTANSLSQQQNQQTIGSSSQQHIDPERLKAFNMFVRLFVDENLDRQVPISRQPKDKVQAIIDSCGRQFPELSDRSRKRIRTYLKSCRRNKRNTPQAGGAVSSSPPPPTNPWPANSSSSDPTVQPQRPTPAHLTSAQAETILAVACQRESDNARRMRLGLEPVAQPYPYSVAPTSTANVFQQPPGAILLNQNGNSGTTLQMSSTSSDEDTGVGDSSFDKSSSNVIDADTENRNTNDEPENRDGSDRREGSASVGGGAGSDSATQSNAVTEESNTAVTGGVSVTSSSPNNNETTGPTDLSVNKSSATPTTSIGTGTVTTPSSVAMGSGYMSGTGFRSLSSTTSTTTVNHRRISSNNSSSTTGMLQLFPTMTTTSNISSGTSTLPLQPSMLNQTTPPVQPSSKLLNKADVVTVRQLIAGYRESAAFLLRSADELEHLLLLRG